MSNELNELNDLFGDIKDDEILDDDKEMSFKLVPRGKGPLREKYRPQKLSELAPTCSVEQLYKILNSPDASRVFLFEGHTGTGKTTCARILARASICVSEDSSNKPCLECKHCKDFESSVDITEINVADQRKVDDARSLVDQMRYLPGLTGYSKKIYILDEVHQYTPEAQQVLLTELENPPSYVLVFLCTTDAHTLNKALVHRTNRIVFKDVTAEIARNIVDQIEILERLHIPEEVKLSLYHHSSGSVRALLNNIQSFIEGGYDPSLWKEDETPAEVKNIATAILDGNWEDLVTNLRNPSIRKSPEEIRLGLESFLRGVVLAVKDGKPRNSLERATKIGEALLRITGSNLTETGVGQYNNLVIKCLRACKAMTS